MTSLYKAEVKKVNEHNKKMVKQRIEKICPAAIRKFHLDIVKRNLTKRGKSKT